MNRAFSECNLVIKHINAVFCVYAQKGKKIMYKIHAQMKVYKAYQNAKSCSRW